MIDWDGSRLEPGGSAALVWLTRLAENDARFYLESVEGIDSRHVHLSGTLQRLVERPGEESVLEQARVRQTWVRSMAQTFQIERVTVGPFQPMPIR